MIQISSIFCDLDQVLVNFLSGCKRLFGKEFNDPILGADYEKWKVIARTPNFWKNLNWMPNAQLLWNQIKNLDTYILSACPRYEDSPSCPLEKREWCVDQLKIPVDRIIITERCKKKLYAFDFDKKLPNLLIDDHERTCAEWKELGGIVIHHQTVTETIKEFKNVLGL